MLLKDLKKSREELVERLREYGLKGDCSTGFCQNKAGEVVIGIYITTEAKTEAVRAFCSNLPNNFRDIVEFRGSISNTHFLGATLG